jgi:Protein of unknown function (DUF3800)
VIIGIDARGTFAAAAPGEGFESSAVAAAIVPERAREQIAAWTKESLVAWGRQGLGELHAAPMNWDQRREVCAMLGARCDLHAAVVVTSNLLLRSKDAVTAHRSRQCVLAQGALDRATSSEGHRRGERAVRLLAGRRVGQSRLNNGEYVLAAMVPRAVMGAAQRAFCFYAGGGWRQEMSELKLVIDEETPATVRFVSESLLPIIGGDERFRLITPAHWRESPVHPLLVKALHPDGDGYWPQKLVGDTIAWVSSHDEPAIQVADFVAWVVCRTINYPVEEIARECFELLRPLVVGESGLCFQLYSIGTRPEDNAIYSHLHSVDQPPQWLERVNAA